MSRRHPHPRPARAIADRGSGKAASLAFYRDALGMEVIYDRAMRTAAARPRTRRPISPAGS